LILQGFSHEVLMVSSDIQLLQPYLDPILPFSPVVFIVGVIVAFLSAVVYEIFPSKRKI
jgi:uncharacterized membrane protein (DUF106 family)